MGMRTARVERYQRRNNEMEMAHIYIQTNAKESHRVISKNWPIDQVIL